MKDLLADYMALLHYTMYGNVQPDIQYSIIASEQRPISQTAAQFCKFFAAVALLPRDNTAVAYNDSIVKSLGTIWAHENE